MLMETGEATQDVGGSTVMIVDARRLFRDAVSLILREDARFEVIAEAATGEDAERYARGHKPDLAIVGPFIAEQVAGADYSSIVSAIRSGSPETRVLLMTSGEDSRRLAEGLDAGATGVVDMDSSASELREAAGRLAAGGVHVPSSIAMAMLRSTRDDEAGLSDREERLLGEIALGFTNAEIAEHMHLSVRTVESHRSRVQQKLGASSRAELVREALDRQLVH